MVKVVLNPDVAYKAIVAEGRENILIAHLDTLVKAIDQNRSFITNGVAWAFYDFRVAYIHESVKASLKYLPDLFEAIDNIRPKPISVIANAKRNIENDLGLAAE